MEKLMSKSGEWIKNNPRVTIAIVLGLLVLLIICMLREGFQVRNAYRTTTDPEMFAAILIKSDTCPYCVEQLKILNTYGPQAWQRIKVLDTNKDATQIRQIVGDYSGVPFWYNPITGQKTSGVKGISDLKKMGILF